MVDEIARLGVAVDSTPAQKAVADLDHLADAGDRASASAGRLSGEWSSMTLTPHQLFSANKSLAQFRQEVTQAASASKGLEAEWQKARFNDAQLYRANVALNRFKTELAQGKTQAQATATTNKVLADSHHQVAKAAAGYTKSAKELAFATRNLPAQFTDIAVSLQAGQNPLTVLLQQGGQIKDMFGGVGSAIRALGGYVLGLITPVTVLTGALAALGVAYLKGEGESIRFQKAVTLTGNSLGATADDLANASASLSNFNRSQSAVSKTMVEVASTGKFFGQQIALVTEAAMNLERYGGQAVSDTIQIFSELAKEPLEASVRLNAEFRHLTTTVYEQIKSLEDQGDTLGAAQVAFTAYSDEVNRRTAEVEANLGTLETAWRAVSGAAKEAWDNMLNIGRADTINQQMKELGEKIREIENPSSAASYAHLGPAGSKRRQEYARMLRAQFKILSDEYVSQQRDATRKLDEQTSANAAIALDQEIRRYATNAEKREREIAKVEKLAQTARAAEMLQQSEGYLKRIEEINRDEAEAVRRIEERYKPKKGQGEKDAERLIKQRAAEYERLNESINEHRSVLEAAGQAQEKLTAFERFAVKVLADFKGGYTLLTQEQQAAILADIEEARVLDQANTARERSNKLLEISAQIRGRLSDIEGRQAQSMDREIRGMGHGRETNALLASMDRVRDEAMRSRMDLEEKFGDLHAENTDEYLRALAEINAAEERMLNREVEFYNRRKEAMGDWRMGARAALEDIESQLSDVAGGTYDAFMTTFSAMSSALNEFARKGKVDIRDFASTVIAELLRIALTIQLSNILTNMFGSAMAKVDANASMGGSTYGGSNLYPGGVSDSGAAVSMAGARPMSMSGSPARAAAPAGVTNNVHTTVILSPNGGASSKTTVDSDDVQMGKKLGDMLDAKIARALVDHTRQGGIIYSYMQGRK